MMIASCSGERASSQLMRIKNEFRTIMTKDKLCSLILMCIESDKHAGFQLMIPSGESLEQKEFLLFMLCIFLRQ